MSNDRQHEHCQRDVVLHFHAEDFQRLTDVRFHRFLGNLHLAGDFFEAIPPAAERKHLAAFFGQFEQRLLIEFIEGIEIEVLRRDIIRQEIIVVKSEDLLALLLVIVVDNAVAERAIEIGLDIFLYIKLMAPEPELYESFLHQILRDRLHARLPDGRMHEQPHMPAIQLPECQLLVLLAHKRHQGLFGIAAVWMVHGQSDGNKLKKRRETLGKAEGVYNLMI